MMKMRNGTGLGTRFLQAQLRLQLLAEYRASLLKIRRW